MARMLPLSVLAVVCGSSACVVGGSQDSPPLALADAGALDLDGPRPDAPDAREIESATDGGGPTGEPLEAGTYVTEVVVRGETREILLIVPQSWKSGGPAVVAIHGNGDSADNFAAWTGLAATASQEGVAVALLVADSGHYNGLDWDAYTSPETNTDFQHALAARDLLLAGAVDPARVYLMGFSQGGFLAFHVAMAEASTFAAAHVSAAASPLGVGLINIAERQIPVDLLIGENDPLIGAATDTAARLEELGFPVRFTVVPQEGHCCPISGRAGDIYSWLSTR